MKTSSQLIEGRSHRAQPAIRVHYPVGSGTRPESSRPVEHRPGITKPARSRRRSRLQAKEKDLGDDLLSQTVASLVPSAQTGLTAVFGMGTGVSPSLWSPKSFSSIVVRRSI